MARWFCCRSHVPCALFSILTVIGIADATAIAQPMNDFAATTEQSCSFGMEKGEPAHRCEVPVPKDCKVVNFPGTTKAWATVSKAGKTFCRFDPKDSDWKSKIVGSCSRCDSVRCSAQFIVRFDCS